MASAIEALMLASRSGSTMLVQIAVMKALNRHVERLFDPERKVTHHSRSFMTVGIELVSNEVHRSAVRSLLPLPSTLPSHGRDDLHFPIR
jgi:hypothetical protein